MAAVGLCEIGVDVLGAPSVCMLIRERGVCMVRGGRCGKALGGMCRKMADQGGLCDWVSGRKRRSAFGVRRLWRSVEYSGRLLGLGQMLELLCKENDSGFARKSLRHTPFTHPRAPDAWSNGWQAASAEIPAGIYRPLLPGCEAGHLASANSAPPSGLPARNAELLAREFGQYECRRVDFGRVVLHCVHSCRVGLTDGLCEVNARLLGADKEPNGACRAEPRQHAAAKEEIGVWGGAPDG